LNLDSKVRRFDDSKILVEAGRLLVRRRADLSKFSEFARMRWYFHKEPG